MFMNRSTLRNNITTGVTDFSFVGDKLIFDELEIFIFYFLRSFSVVQSLDQLRVLIRFFPHEEQIILKLFEGLRNCGRLNNSYEVL
jgi:hypothetical protein